MMTTEQLTVLLQHHVDLSNAMGTLLAALKKSGCLEDPAALDAIDDMTDSMKAVLAHIINIRSQH